LELPGPEAHGVSNIPFCSRLYRLKENLCTEADHKLLK